MVDVSCDGMFPFEFTKFYFQPHTYGFWRPIEVEIGFIEDDIQIESTRNLKDKYLLL